MRPTGRSLVVLSLLWPGVAGAGESAGVPRSEIEQLEAQLDQAVAKVSRASVGIVVGRAEGSRGYHVPGIGAVFVLAPRALPRTRGVVAWSQEIAPGSTVIQIQPVPADGPATAGTPPPDRRRLRIRTGPHAVPLDPDQARQIAELEAQASEFQREAELARLLAEREFEQFAMDVQVMLEPPPSPVAAAPP